MKLKIVLSLLALFTLQCLSNQTLAQNVSTKGNIVVTGKVTSKVNGEPLFGATVALQGSRTAVITNTAGIYSISIPSTGGTLVITYAGMTIQTKEVHQSGNFDFVLESGGALDEVVVVGYGTQKKSVVTGAISSVKASDIDNQPIGRVEQFLQGRASGITVAASSGQPGSALTVRVRGTTTTNGGNDPLYIVDGVPVDIGGIDYLNPSDIESVEVLKDAASAAIYGTRAAAGVILVTTKKGKAGKTVMSYNGYYGTQAPAKKLDMLNATEYRYASQRSFGSWWRWHSFPQCFHPRERNGLAIGDF